MAKHSKISVAEERFELLLKKTENNVLIKAYGEFKDLMVTKTQNVLHLLARQNEKIRELETNTNTDADD